MKNPMLLAQVIACIFHVQGFVLTDQPSQLVHTISMCCAGLGRPRSQRTSKASSDGTGRRASNLPEVPDLSFMLAKTLQRPHTAYDSI